MYSVLPFILLADWILSTVFSFVLGFIGLITVPLILILGLGDFPN